MKKNMLLSILIVFISIFTISEVKAYDFTEINDFEKIFKVKNTIDNYTGTCVYQTADKSKTLAFSIGYYYYITEDFATIELCGLGNTETQNCAREGGMLNTYAFYKYRNQSVPSYDSVSSRKCPSYVLKTYGSNVEGYIKKNGNMDYVEDNYYDLYLGASISKLYIFIDNATTFENESVKTKKNYSELVSGLWHSKVNFKNAPEVYYVTDASQFSQIDTTEYDPRDGNMACSYKPFDANNRVSGITNVVLFNDGTKIIIKGAYETDQTGFTKITNDVYYNSNGEKTSDYKNSTSNNVCDSCYLYINTSDSEYTYFSDSKEFNGLAATHVLNANDCLEGYAEVGCGAISEYAWKAYYIMIIGGAVLTVVFGIMDFVSATASGDKENLTKAWKKFMKRFIALAILLLLPYLLEFMFGILPPIEGMNQDNPLCR